jgi:signal transduction histidine kinase
VDGGKILLGMINDLLDVSKMESGTLSLEYNQVSATRLLDSAQRQVQALATAQGLTLTSEVAPETPVFQADEDKLVRTLVNLLSNAIKFTPEGGGIDISVRLAKDRARYCLSPSGIQARAFPRMSWSISSTSSAKWSPANQDARCRRPGSDVLQDGSRSTRRVHLGGKRGWQGQHLFLPSPR